jgi:hypothetical protein
MSEAPSALGRRVIVTGLAGSGKSTFSLALAAKTGLPVIHLDLHFWKPGWVAPSETKWREKLCGVLAGNAWIADGNYHETLDLANTKSFRSTVSMWPFTCSDPSGRSENSSTVWTPTTWKPTTVDRTPSDSPLTPGSESRHQRGKRCLTRH